MFPTYSPSYDCGTFSLSGMLSIENVKWRTKLLLSSYMVRTFGGKGMARFSVRQENLLGKWKIRTELNGKTLTLRTIMFTYWVIIVGKWASQVAVFKTVCVLGDFSYVNGRRIFFALCLFLSLSVSHSMSFIFLDKSNKTFSLAKISKSSWLFVVFIFVVLAVSTLIRANIHIAFVMAIIWILNGVPFQLCWSYDKTFSYIKVSGKSAANSSQQIQWMSQTDERTNIHI